MNATQDPSSETINPGYDTARSLSRPLQGRMVAGVAAGIADLLNVDVTLVRIAFAVITVAGGGVGLVLYLAGWLLIPEEGHDQSLASELLQSVSARR